MFPVISLIIIIVALIIIIIIIVRKFPVLAILDVGRIPGEKEAKFKEEIIKARVERDVAVLSGWFGRIWLWLEKRLGLVLRNWQTHLKKVKINYKVSIRVPKQKKQEQIKELFLAAEVATKKEDEEDVEDKLVEIISLDQKNLAAFVQLAELYTEQKKWTEARETYAYALKLARQKMRGDEGAGETTPQQVCFALAGVEKEAGDSAAALENIREALEHEPNNPRYLDLILDLSIIIKDKNLAIEIWEKLATVNPENQKLEEWRDKIENL